MKKILVIEDEFDVRNNIEQILSFSNFHTIEASDGHSGLYLAKEETPDLIICDVMMPELSGYEVLAALREDEKTAHIPFIFLTAMSTRSDMRQGMEVGADDFLTKPFTTEELLKAIASQLNKQKLVERKTQLALNQLRNCITSSLPHELHTPLSGILGMSQFLMEDSELIHTAEGYEIAEAIHTSALRLYKLTQNFLLYADLEMLASDSERLQELQTSPSTTNIWEVVVEVALQQAHAANRDNDLKFDIEDGVALMPTAKLKKVVEELIENAFKFSSAGTPVYVTGLMGDRTYHLCMIDQGRGMTASEIQRVGAYMQFERHLYEQQGAGMGLAIARRIVELYGGTLKIDSIPGRQTTVHLILPS